MSGNAPSNDEEAMSSQTPREEPGTTVLQNEADPVGIQQMLRLLNAYSSQQTEDQSPQGPSEDDLRYMIINLDLQQLVIESRLNVYADVLLMRIPARPSTPVSSVDQLSTQQILDLRRILVCDIKEVKCLAVLRENNKRHSRGLDEAEKALRSAKEVVDPGFWELMNGHVQDHRRASRSLATRVHHLRRTIERS
ncbi:hypothetical protein D6C84_06357 [Aureobasidium pullulans]|uniref:Uncharacterized protein n=1 Tax=Aureobasidium pullulans TaxID=5580 RepID=A0A4S9XPA9_AURPU|nr:hypothetical protein D6C84_06357 [Aureobasidium pullulans]